MLGQEFFVNGQNILLPSQFFKTAKFNVQNANTPPGAAPWAIRRFGPWDVFRVVFGDQWSGDIGRAVTKVRAELGGPFAGTGTYPYTDLTGATEFWWSWWLYIPWLPTWAYALTEHVCGQLHPGSVRDGVSVGVSPPFAVHFDPTPGQGVYTSRRQDPANTLVAGGQWTDEHIDYRDATVTPDSLPLLTRFVAQVRYGGPTAGAGTLNVWRDGSPIISLASTDIGYSAIPFGGTTPTDNTKGPAWKYGIYTNEIGTPSHPTPRVVEYGAMEAPAAGTSLVDRIGRPVIVPEPIAA